MPVRLITSLITSGDRDNKVIAKDESVTTYLYLGLCEIQRNRPFADRHKI